MKLLVFITILFALIFQLGIAQSNSDLHLEINSPIVQDADSCVVVVTFKNVGDTNIDLYSGHWGVQSAMGGILQFDIIANDNDTLYYRRLGPEPLYPHERDTMTLVPGRKYEESIDLTKYYAYPGDHSRLIVDSSWVWKPGDWIPGIYYFYCRYEYLHKPEQAGGKNLWQGKAKSDVLGVLMGK